jgi:tRNA(Ile)-lysidine synthase
LVDVAVSGGPDSLGLLLLARDAGLEVRVHHVDHHVRASSTEDADFVVALAHELGLSVVVHDVYLEAGPNFEARARSERRRVLPEGTLTGHTMDDLAETVLLNVLRGAGVEGLSPMVDDPTKPLLDVRRGDLHEFVAARGYRARHDETNDDLTYRRNRVRHQVLPLLNAVAERDVVPLLARQAANLYEDRAWLGELLAGDVALRLEEADCRELRSWPEARLKRWLRAHLAARDELGDDHPPSRAALERALRVVRGDVAAAELEGGRRLSRTNQRLALEDGSTTLSGHG